MATRMVLLAALVAIAAVHMATAQSTVIGIMGSWGMGPDGTIQASDVGTYYPMQKAVANALGEYCQQLGCHLVLGVGDNFNSAGISSQTGVKDPQWWSSWAGIYTHPYLQSIPFWHSLGNQDYGYPVIVNYTNWQPVSGGFVPNATSLYWIQHANYSIQPQIEYTWSDPQDRWKLPGRFYNQLFSDVPVKFGLTVMDSSPYNFKYCCDINSSVSSFNPLYDINDNGIKGAYPTAKPCDANNPPVFNTPELKYACQNKIRDGQTAWAKRVLQNYNSLGVWNLWVGHHAPLNIQEGLSNPWSFVVRDIMNTANAKPHFALSGHENVLALNVNKMVNKTVFASIGSSGSVQSYLGNPQAAAWNASGLFSPGSGIPGSGFGASDTLRADTQGWDLGDWKFQAAYSGFGILTLNDTHGTIAFYGYKFPNTLTSEAQRSAVASTPYTSFNKLYEYTIAKF